MCVSGDKKTCRPLEQRREEILELEAGVLASDVSKTCSWRWHQGLWMVD